MLLVSYEAHIYASSELQGHYKDNTRIDTTRIRYDKIEYSLKHIAFLSDMSSQAAPTIGHGDQSSCRAATDRWKMERPRKT